MSEAKKEWLKTQWTYWFIVAAVSLVGMLWLLHAGPTPVIRITTPLDENAPFWYMISAFPILGMLIAELVAVTAQQGIDC